MSQQKQVPDEELQPFGITLIAALTAIIPLVVLLRDEPQTSRVLAALVGVVAGTGLFLQKGWGRWLTVAFYATSIVLLFLQKAPLPILLLTCLLPVTILVYLFLPGVVASFQKKSD